MIELLITSSLLILAVLAARALLAGRISRRMQYALWGLVLLRLLLPVSLPQSRASVLNALPDTAQVSLARPEEFSGETLPVPVDTEVQTGTAPETDLAQPATGGMQAGISGGVADIADDTSGSEPHPEWSLNPAALLPVIWAAGAVLTGGAMLWANLRFSLRLRRERCQLDLEPEITGGLPVYLCHELASPCLHGLLHPAIYLNPAALENRERLDFVLAHEKTHYRHKDHIWGALRCVLLAMYWFDPLVWWAAAASRRDCELACDEAVTAAMEEARRRDYGRCLVELIPNRARGTALLAATSMSGSAGAMQRRLKAIVTAKKPRRAAIALTLAGAVLLTACTFTGAKAKTIASADDLIGEGETVRRRVSWQQESGTQEIILVQVSAAPEGETLQDGQGWFKLYYWNSSRENTAENTLYYEGRLSYRYPIQVIALNPDGSTSDYSQPTADDTVHLLNVYLYQPDASYSRYDWQDGMLSDLALKLSAPGPLAEGEDPSMQDTMLEQLACSLRPVEGGIQFTIPAAGEWTGADWRLGLYRMDGEAITRDLPEAFTSQNWQPGQSYLVPYSCLADGPVALMAWLADEPGSDVLAENASIAVYDPFAMATNIYEGAYAHITGQTRSEEERLRMLPDPDFQREETDRQQALEQLWASCTWQDGNLTFTIPEGLSPENEELRVYWAEPGTGMLNTTDWDDYGISMTLNRNGGSSTLAIDEQGLLAGQTWQPGDTITVNGTGRGDRSQPVLALRDKASRLEQQIRLPASAQPLPAATPEPTDPGSIAPQADYEFYDVEPAQNEEFHQRLDALVEGIQYSQGGLLTVTIPESAEPGEWELRLMRYNESRGSWTIVSAGLPDAFVRQGWQPGQQETVDAETMAASSWKMEAKNTVLGGWAQFRLGLSGTPLAPTPTPIRPEADQQARADAAEQQYENWVASQSTYRPTPTPMPINSLGGEGYPEGRVRSRGTLELDGRTQELVALQIQPPEGVTLAEDELYLNLYYRDSQAPNPEFGLAFTGPVSVYQTFAIDYRDAESRTLTGTSPEGAASMELKIRLHSEPNQSSASDWRHYRVDEAGITVS
ncbi:M56 family metallopeptidase [Fournierella massiliensis]|uniref:M56 family metallopeptidase n=1 Tax=Allofournierella massiliensis TaxID=1650663 RepID=UPI003520A8FD